MDKEKELADKLRTSIKELDSLIREATELGLKVELFEYKRDMASNEWMVEISKIIKL